MTTKDQEQKNSSPFADVIRQSLIIAAISLVLVGAAQPVLYVIGCHTELYDYSVLRFILGSLYGWLLGVGNFVAMAVSLIMMTSSASDRQEGQKRAQAAYMGRLVVLLLFAVGGCFIPIFHTAAILISLALTQFGIFAYSLIFKLSEAKKLAKTEKNPPLDDIDAPLDDIDAPLEDGDGQAPDISPEDPTNPAEENENKEEKIEE